MLIKCENVKKHAILYKVIHENEAAYQPRHTCRAAERDGPHRLSEVGGSKELRKLKEASIDES